MMRSSVAIIHVLTFFYVSTNSDTSLFHRGKMFRQKLHKFLESICHDADTEDR